VRRVFYRTSLCCQPFFHLFFVETLIQTRRFRTQAQQPMPVISLLILTRTESQNQLKSYLKSTS
jgi:hypothetical protein